MTGANGLRVLIVSAAMGGGHLQISHELRRRLEDRGHEATVVDVLEVMPRPVGGWLHRLYPWLVNRAPRLYQLIYEVFFLADQDAGERAGIPVRLSLPGLRRLVAQTPPDVAVSTHPLSALALGELRRQGDLECPAVTLITTFSVNNLWIHPDADLELCISDEAARDATRRTGRPAVVSGPVVRPAFLRGRDPEARRRIRADLDIPDNAKVALVTTGSMGLEGSALAAAETIASRPGWVPLVLCGRSNDLYERIQQARGIRALPWVDDMPAVMSAADVLVDNAGGMSSKEALAIGLPVVTFRPISGHGRDDASSLARLGLTHVTEDEQHLVEVLEDLLRDPDAVRERVQRGRRLFVADAADLVEQASSPGAPLSAAASD